MSGSVGVWCWIWGWGRGEGRLAASKSGICLGMCSIAGAVTMFCWVGVLEGDTIWGVGLLDAGAVKDEVVVMVVGC